MRGKLLILLICGMLAGIAGCNLVLPEVTHQPVIRNPFPQLSRVAVAPFFNHSDESTVDGREFAMAYYAALQATPGFEVVPLGVVEEAILQHRIDLSSAGEARRLAKILGADAVAIGAVTDFSPYYPPRCGLKVEWYTANEGFHEIPAGYGLPWNTPEEEFIPDELVYESQMALARVQMATQTPDCSGSCEPLPAPPQAPQQIPQQVPQQSALDTLLVNSAGNTASGRASSGASTLELVSSEEAMPADEVAMPSASETSASASTSSGNGVGTIDSNLAIGPGGAVVTMPLDWPGEECFCPPAMHAVRPPCIPYHGPVLSHTQLYNGSDPHFTEALQGYAYFRDDTRLGNWKSYLKRSDDFIRFCCHMHISEMLSARGGSRKTRVVWRWPESR